LKEIAENLAQYQRESLREYTYTNDEGDAVVATVEMSKMQASRIQLIRDDLKRHGTHHQEAADGFTYKVIGETIC
jgi:peptidyl-tRNA hydrolase